MIDAIKNISRAAKILIALGLVIALLWFLGPLRADRGVNVSEENAISIARDYIDFEAEHIAARMIRQGFNTKPVWAISLSIPLEDGEFDQLTIVEIDARNGEIIKVTRRG